MKSNREKSVKTKTLSWRKLLSCFISGEAEEEGRRKRSKKSTGSRNKGDLAGLKRAEECASYVKASTQHFWGNGILFQRYKMPNLLTWKSPCLHRSWICSCKVSLQENYSHRWFYLGVIPSIQWKVSRTTTKKNEMFINMWETKDIKWGRLYIETIKLWRKLKVKHVDTLSRHTLFMGQEV